MHEVVSTVTNLVLLERAPVAALQAAREIAGTIANSNNRVFLNSDSLLLNLVRTLQEHSALQPSLHGTPCPDISKSSSIKPVPS